MKERGERFAMLTSYDQLTAEIFDEAGIPVLLVGDSAANNVLGYETTLPVTVDELLPLVRAVARGAQRALVVADLPFGSYQSSPEQALETSVRFMKEGGAHAVKLEGGAPVVPQVRAPGHGRDPGDGAHRLHARRASTGSAATACRAAATPATQLVQRRPGPAGGRRLRRRAGDGPGRRGQAGHRRARRSRPSASAPGVDCDGQVLVWQDMAGLRAGPLPRFVKQYADLRTAARRRRPAVRRATSRRRDYPGEEHAFH